ncbi:MAG: lamin tail domain-containing protein [Candidatus Cloacimonetes bacterium]|nr:lamin tail domain-containing protein [Candidatus Cloacimonadota bacterium]
MKSFFFLLLVFIFRVSLFTIVINELLYDPDGSDSGNEWIELYNQDTISVNLEGWKLEKAGTSFVPVYTFPFLNLEPDGYLLIAEENVPEADLYCSLAFQNGGSATDGVRIVSPDGLYSDTVLYDEPNTNSLPDDSGNIGSSFAPDASSGNTLARVEDGVDCNQSGIDFFECYYPTPGSANFFPQDLELKSSEIIVTPSSCELVLVIRNLSTKHVDNFSGTVEIVLNDYLFGNYPLPEIPALDSLEYRINLDQIECEYMLIKSTVSYLYDYELSNNTGYCSACPGNSPLVINEVLFKPSVNRQEWIEILRSSPCEYLVDNFVIYDANAGKIEFSLSCSQNQYLLVCQDKLQILEEFPFLSEDQVLESLSWTALNNGDETLTLCDTLGTVFEEIYYTGENCPVDFSLERINPILPADQNNWGVSIRGSTPGKINSIFTEYIPTKAKIDLQPNPFSPSQGQSIIISYQLPEMLNLVTMRIFDLKGRLIWIIQDQVYEATTGQQLWRGNGSDGANVSPGLYILLWEASGIGSGKITREKKIIAVAG